jgi:hypothetical protein
MYTNTPPLDPATIEGVFRRKDVGRLTPAQLAAAVQRSLPEIRRLNIPVGKDGATGPAEISAWLGEPQKRQRKHRARTAPDCRRHTAARRALVP